MKNNQKEWEGYNFEQLKFQKILNLTRIEIEKNALVNQTQALTHYGTKAQTMWGRWSSALNYVDYALIAFKISRRLLKIFRKK